MGTKGTNGNWREVKGPKPGKKSPIEKKTVKGNLPKRKDGKY